MSMLAASRVAKILSAGSMSKVGSSSNDPTFNLSRHMGTAKVGPRQTPNIKKSRLNPLQTISSSTENSSNHHLRRNGFTIHTTKTRSSSEEERSTKADNAKERKTQVAVVTATQKFRKAVSKIAKQTITESPNTTKELRLNDILPIMNEEQSETTTTAHDEITETALDGDTETITKPYKLWLPKTRKLSHPVEVDSAKLPHPVKVDSAKLPHPVDSAKLPHPVEVDSAKLPHSVEVDSASLNKRKRGPTVAPRVKPFRRHRPPNGFNDGFRVTSGLADAYNRDRQLDTSPSRSKTSAVPPSWTEEPPCDY
ncbi:uncharacterized protein [Argopecten irradians]|uniref:uncharacterized protein n=1 Tax=Argopecten irradians TaxID=31199 RepID=UPI00371B83D8